MNESRVSSMNPPTAPSWSAEEEANRLMDDVFSDIDSLLTGKQPSVKFQSPPSSENSSLQSVIEPQVDFVVGVPLEIPEQITGENVEIVLKRGWGYYSERLFFMGSCASLVGVLLWMAVSDRLRIPQFLTQPVPVTEVATTPKTTTQPIFADYVQRALDSIDRQQAPQPIPAAPQTGVALAPEQNAQGQNPQVIERIYIPVYPPDIAANGTKPITQMPAIKPAAPRVFIPAPQQPKVVNSTPVALMPPPPPLSTMPSLPAPPAASKEMYTLVGVLESGDNSAALFNINGVTQRFKVGEQVGTSNWKILSIQNRQILLGQGGQTKVLMSGEAFSGN